MDIQITPEMIEEARKKKQEAERMANNFDNDNPENPEEPFCIGCI